MEEPASDDLPDQLVIDANILFSFFESDSARRGMVKKLRRSGCRLSSPDYVFEELTRDRDRIKKFANIPETEFTFLLSLLERTIDTVDRERYEKELDAGSEVSPHGKDVPYFALALHLNSAIWSDEKGFKEQGEVPVYSTSDLYDLLKS